MTLNPPPAVASWISPSRRWPLERFGELADHLERNDHVCPLLFAGPEEHGLIREMRAAFPRSTVILDRLTIPQLVAALARLSVFISNDTGPMHIAAAVSGRLVSIHTWTDPRRVGPYNPDAWIWRNGDLQQMRDFSAIGKIKKGRRFRISDSAGVVELAQRFVSKSN